MPVFFVGFAGLGAGLGGVAQKKEVKSVSYNLFGVAYHAIGLLLC